jgi:hypothetical protein
MSTPKSVWVLAKKAGAKMADIKFVNTRLRPHPYEFFLYHDV